MKEDVLKEFRGIITENNIIKYLQEEIRQIHATRNVSRSIINGKLEIDDLLPLQEQEIKRLEKMIEHLRLMKKEIRYFETYKEMWLELYNEVKKPCGIEYMQDLEAKHQDELMVWENDKRNKE